MDSVTVRIAERAAALIEERHWAAETLRGAFSWAVCGAPLTHNDYEALQAFDRYWCGAPLYYSDGRRETECAIDKARRVGPDETVRALRAFVIAERRRARGMSDPLNVARAHIARSIAAGAPVIVEQRS